MNYALLFSTFLYIQLVDTITNKIENRDIVDLKSAQNLDNIDGFVVEHLVNSTQNIEKLQVLSREGGDNYTSPQSLIITFLFVGISTFGTFIAFSLVASFS